MIKYTKQAYEKHLNAIIIDHYSESQALDTFHHLGAKEVISRNYHNRTLGTLLRRKDPVQFEVNFNEWCRA